MRLEQNWKPGPDGTCKQRKALLSAPDKGEEGRKETTEGGPHAKKAFLLPSLWSLFYH